MSLPDVPTNGVRHGPLPDEPRDGAWRPFYRLVGLLFAIFPVATILSTRPDPVEVALVLAGTGLFALVLLRGTGAPVPGPDGFVRPDPVPRTVEAIAHTAGPKIAAVVAIIVISVALTVLRPDAGWFAFFYYASVSAGTIRVPRVAIGLMVVTGVVAAISFVFARDNPADALVQGLSVTVIGLTVFSAVAVRRTNRALVAARDELARLAVADERARIARDLHDTLGHDLSVIALKSELAGRLLPGDPDRASAEIADVERVAREALSAVRGTIGGYRQPTLASELAGARSALAAAGIENRVEPAPERLPPTTDAILGWAVREGVTNVLRHGRGRSAEVLVEVTVSDAAIEIRNSAPWSQDPRADTPQDPPAGPVASRTRATTTDALDRARTPGSGMGLAGLRERVATVGGQVEAGPLPDGGFRLRVSLPVGPVPMTAPASGAPG